MAFCAFGHLTIALFWRFVDMVMVVGKLRSYALNFIYNDVAFCYINSFDQPIYFFGTGDQDKIIIKFITFNQFFFFFLS